MTRSRWTWAAARCRGVMHAGNGTRLQDASVCFSPSASPGVLVAAVADGAGAASHAGEGAWLTCRMICLAARQHFAQRASLPEEAVVATWVRGARERIVAAARRRQLTPRDFAATLVLAVSNGLETLTVHVGDGAAVARDAQGEWRALSWPENGEYAPMTYFVTDEPPGRVRISWHREEISALALLTDGLERLALNFGARVPHEPFFAGIALPVAASEMQGRDPGLSQLLVRFLDSEAVNLRTQDDKTIILAIRR
jgi:hypothetical protein